MKKCSHDSGCTVVLNALATTMEMSGLSQLSQIFKRQQEQGSIEYREWAEETWEVEIHKSEIRFEIDRLFRQHGVQIPFPQRTLHIPNSVTFWQDSDKRNQ